MNETEFLHLANEHLEHLEDWVDDATDGAISCLRSGNVLTMETDQGEQIIVNIQTPMQELWLASKAGGRHFRRDEQGVWRCTRNGDSLEKAIEDALTLYDLS